ncbi:MAG: NAD-dependent epimerase/dehydratase family protein [Microbacteriaceae bacterium]
MTEPASTVFPVGTVPPVGTVLVTGGTGFVARWCIRALLERGFRVRTTVRDLARADEVRALHPEPIEVLRAELLEDEGWADAVAGCAGVLHVASPMGAGRAPADPDELVVPAREGALRVLRAAVAAGVPRVVMTSSGAAATPPPGATGEFDESLWTDPAQPGLDPYRRSKAIAERAAWDCIADARGTELATVLPGAVFGPPLGAASADGSIEVIARMLRGMPGAPRIGLQIVDVRDVADLHVRALLDPEAAGRRFLAVGGFLWMREVGAVLRRLPEGSRAPVRELPDWSVRLLARRQPGLGQLVPMLGRRYRYSTAAARSLGWRPRDAETTVLDTARALIAANHPAAGRPAAD